MSSSTARTTRAPNSAPASAATVTSSPPAQTRSPPGATVSRVQAPRGELLYYLKSAGGASPDRVKVRTPSLCNWGSVITTAPGHKLADVPMLIAGIDPCFSCNDRLVTIRGRHDTDTWTWARLRQY